MKFDRTTAILAILALASIGFAQRAYGQDTKNCSKPAIGNDSPLAAPGAACQVTTAPPSYRIA